MNIQKLLKANWKKGLGLLEILFLLHFLIISIYGLTTKAHKSDLIVILGTKVDTTGIPSLRLQERLNEGLMLYNQGFAKKIMVSGGIGMEGFDEAEVMAEYLIQHGVDSANVFRDSLGINTFASATNCKMILQNEKIESVIIVSQYFHLLRSKIGFQKMGISKVSAQGPAYFEWRDFYSITREMIGVYYYLVREYS